MQTEIIKYPESEKLFISFTKPDGKKAQVGLTEEELSILASQANKASGVLTMNEYQAKAKSTCEGNSYSWTYLSAEISEEKGEFDGKVAKMVRKNELPIFFTREDVINMSEEKRDALKKELGDILWGVAVMADWFGWTFEDVGATNLAKLAGRVKRNTIVGEGDER